MDNKDNKYLTTLDESLQYAQEIALEHFKNFDISIRTPEIKQFLLSEIESHIKNNEYQVAILLPQFNYIDEQGKIRDIVYHIAAQIELSQLLNIAEYESILFIDNKFRINGASDGELKDCQYHTIKKCLKYPLYLKYFKIIDHITEDFEMKADLFFENCEFLGKIKLYKNEIPIKYTIEMKNCTFYKEFIMSNKNFSKGVYFNNSTFKGYADFHESKFDTTACFYGVTFKELPKFSACYFKEPRNVNLINLDISSFDFKKVVDFIENNFNDKQCMAEVQQNSDNKPKIEQKYKSKYAKNIKDSFRTIKDIFIAQNNALEAQEWHKLELYAKEKEIELNLEKTTHNYSHSNLNNTKTKFKKTKLSEKFKLALMTRLIKYSKLKILRFFNGMPDLTIWTDCILLKLYRNTSNHHTNFIKILNFFICMIAVYAVFNGIFDKTINFFIVPYPHITAMLYGIAIYVAIIFALLLMHKNFFIRYSLSIVFIIYSAIFVSMTTYLSCVAIQIFYLIIYIFVIIIFYCLFICHFSIIAFFLRCFIYLVFLYTIILNTQIINPFIGIFKTDYTIDSRLETQMLTINNQDMQILASIALKQFDINNKNIENPKDIIYNNENILFEFYNKIKDGKKKDYKNILNVLETKYLLQENKIKPLQKLRDKIFNENDSLRIISDIITENYPQKINGNYSAEENIVNNNNKAIYILQAIENDNIRYTLKIIYINKIKNDILKTTNIIYSIIILLCIFSLQKTARKNSIIPS